MDKETAEYMIDRLESYLHHIENESYHMARAKILADISALKVTATGEGREIEENEK